MSGLVIMKGGEVSWGRGGLYMTLFFFFLFSFFFCVSFSILGIHRIPLLFLWFFFFFERGRATCALFGQISEDLGDWDTSSVPTLPKVPTYLTPLIRKHGDFFIFCLFGLQNSSASWARALDCCPDMRTPQCVDAVGGFLRFFFFFFFFLLYFIYAPWKTGPK